jgi:hypothetical protein
MDETRAHGSTETVPPSQVYEMTARKLFELDPAAHCRHLGIPFTGQPKILPKALPPITLPGDVLLVRTGPDEIAHIVHVLERPEDLDAQMLLYRSAIARAYPGNEVTQYEIVLGEDGDDDLADALEEALRDDSLQEDDLDDEDLDDSSDDSSDDDAEPAVQPYV